MLSQFQVAILTFVLIRIFPKIIIFVQKIVFCPREKFSEKIKLSRNILYVTFSMRRKFMENCRIRIKFVFEYRNIKKNNLTLVSLIKSVVVEPN